MNKRFRTAAALAVLVWAGQACAQITFFEPRPRFSFFL